MEILQSMVASGEQITFAGLFIVLLVWVINSNDKRETKYQDTISKLADSLNDFGDLKESVKGIKETVDRWVK